MVIYEMITRDHPFPDRPPLSAAFAIAVEHLRPQLPADLPTPIERLMQRCWETDPSKRPTFQEIEQLLSDIGRSMSPDGLAWLDAPHGHPGLPCSRPSGAATACGDLVGGAGGMGDASASAVAVLMGITTDGDAAGGATGGAAGALDRGGGNANPNDGSSSGNAGNSRDLQAAKRHKSEE
jgi:hypothetical protein